MGVSAPGGDDEREQAERAVLRPQRVHTRGGVRDLAGQMLRRLGQRANFRAVDEETGRPDRDDGACRSRTMVDTSNTKRADAAVEDRCGVPQLFRCQRRVRLRSRSGFWSGSLTGQAGRSSDLLFGFEN